MYADDIKIFWKIRDHNDCLLLQNNLNSVIRWCFHNRLVINQDKCVVMTYSLKKDLIYFDYEVNGTVLRRPATVSDLGVIFDCKLSFVEHVNHVRAQACSTLGFIIRNSKDFCENRTLILLFNAFVRSKLLYGCTIWFPYYAVHIASLERVLRKFLKYLSFREDGTYPIIGFPQGDLLQRHSVMSLVDNVKRAHALFVYKILNGSTDCPFILSKLCFNTNSCASRHYNIFYLPTPRTNVCKFSPLFNMCRYSNNAQRLVDFFCASLHAVKSLDYRRI